MFKGMYITLLSAAVFSGCYSSSQKSTPVLSSNQVQQHSAVLQNQQQAVSRSQQMMIHNQLQIPQSGKVQNLNNHAEGQVDLKNIQPLTIPAPAADKNLIQLALLLDTSNSMDGLIDQAKSQLWRIVNELAKANKLGSDICFEVALFEYGNSKLKPSDGYIRKVQGLTRDLDQISEDLFSLKTNGGQEYCGHVIASAVNQLNWNPSPEALKIIYIAGNEPFVQGCVDYKDSCMSAHSKGLITNTIFCGSYEAGIATKWQHGAALGKGDYFSINSNKKLKGIKTPYDDELITLSNEINKTYVAYGDRREYYQNRQVAQDSNAISISKSISAGRAASKASSLYVNSNWDLVDAINRNTVKIEKIKQEDLPQELRDKSLEEIKKHLEEKLVERKEIQKKIAGLSKKRTVFMSEKMAEMSKDGESTLDTVMIKSLRAQAKAGGFSFKD